ncbi:DUF5302 domain-containing protein [Sphaerisporangium dianthi]|uniref:DUF5302 domain-containing protein n=1 Tax=Sphaerisporangium dianthi TaxID=1436120 RepID=A0ABV9CDG4_9ACTN
MTADAPEPQTPTRAAETPAYATRGAETPDAETSGAETPAADVPGPDTPDDELKRKFREALERKRRTQAESNGGGRGKDGSKIHGTHGPVGGKRSFRRKSGG